MISPRNRRHALVAVTILLAALMMGLGTAGCSKKDEKGGKKAANSKDGNTSATLASGGGDKAGESKPGSRRGRRGGGDGKSGGSRNNQEFLTPVIVEKVSRGEMLVTVLATANVVPIRSETLLAGESGNVVFARAWEEGAYVTSGTLIATFDNDDLRKQLKNSEADLEIQQQSLDLSRTRMRQSIKEFGITQDLYARGLAPLRDVERAKLERETSENSLHRDEINLQKARLSLQTLRENMKQLQLRAPFDGMLVSRATIEGRAGMPRTMGTEPLRTLEGRFVSKNTSICGLMDIRRVRLLCDVTSKDIARIAPGQEAFGVVYGRENLDVRGRVLSVASNVNSDTRAFEVAIEVDNKDGRLRPGMFGRVEIIVQRLPDVISIPKAVVQQRGEKQVVYRVERSPEFPSPIAREVEVELGAQSKESVEVQYGLTSGNELVIKGFEILQDKLPLQVSYADDPTTG